MPRVRKVVPGNETVTARGGAEGGGGDTSTSCYLLCPQGHCSILSLKPVWGRNNDLFIRCQLYARSLLGTRITDDLYNNPAELGVSFSWRHEWGLQKVLGPALGPTARLLRKIAFRICVGDVWWLGQEGGRQGSCKVITDMSLRATSHRPGHWQRWH